MNAKPIDGVVAPQKPAPTPAKIAARSPRLPRRSRLLMAAVLIIVAAAMSVLLLHHSSRNLDDVHVIEGLVSKHMLLPQNEVPALATITDKSKLTTPFLQQADNGDKLLIYQKAKKVIIYRPSIDRIVDAGPVTIASP